MGRLRKGNEGESDGEGKERLICEGEERTEGWYCWGCGRSSSGL